MLNDEKKENSQVHHIFYSPVLHNTVNATPGADMWRRHCQMALGGCSRLEKVVGNDLS